MMRKKEENRSFALALIDSGAHLQFLMRRRRLFATAECRIGTFSMSFGKKGPCAAGGVSYTLRNGCQYLKERKKEEIPPFDWKLARLFFFFPSIRQQLKTFVSSDFSRRQLNLPFRHCGSNSFDPLGPRAQHLSLG
jgi:hypothetical protein